MERRFKRPHKPEIFQDFKDRMAHAHHTRVSDAFKAIAATGLIDVRAETIQTKANEGIGDKHWWRKITLGSVHDAIVAMKTRGEVISRHIPNPRKRDVSDPHQIEVFTYLPPEQRHDPQE